jgi:hypothetical protein
MQLELKRGLAREAPLSLFRSVFFATPFETLAHGLGDHGGETVDQAGKFGVQGADLRLQVFDVPYESLQIDAVKLPLDHGEIIPVEARLFKNIACHHLLALDLLFERFEFFPCYI